MPDKGQLLIAELALTGDHSFGRSVIFLTEHNVEGSVGFILNKQIDLKLSELLPDINKDFPIYKGGPVEQDNLYYIHKIPEIIPGSIAVSDGIFWGGDFDILYEELKKGNISADKIKFFLGYSGWMPYQLEDEIDQKSWIIKDNKFNIFQERDASIWKEEIKKLGGDYLIWANSPENPNYN